MKNFLFKTIASLTGALLALNLAVGSALTGVIAAVFNFGSLVIKTIAERLLILVDADRYRHASLATSQSSELMELNLLMAANRVKEDAVGSRMWTVGHTIALNKIGNALYSSCNWEPARIHKYFKGVVESIPGMVYINSDDFDDKTSV